MPRRTLTDGHVRLGKPLLLLLAVAAMAGCAPEEDEDATLVESQALAGGPSAPSVSVSGAKISWGAVSTADGYNVYRNDSYLTTVNAPTSSFTASTSGQYYVTAFDKNVSPTAFSSRSNTVQVTVGGTTSPPPPPPSPPPSTGGGSTTSSGCLDVNVNRTFPPVNGFSCFNGPRDTNAHGWFSGGWQGNGTASRSADGRQFGVKWKNTNAMSGSHEEFDLSVARSGWVAKDFGYGNVKVNNIPLGQGVLTSKGRFITPLAQGKFHNQAIIWMTQNVDTEYNRRINGSCSRDSVDITVATFADPTVRAAYKTTHDTGSPANTILNKSTIYLGDISLSGTTYWAFKRPIGDVCEKESYYLLRSQDMAYTSGSSQLAQIDIRQVVDQLAGRSSGSNYLKDWYVFMAGWELAGGNSSQGANGSQVEFKYDCLSFPIFKTVSGKTPTLSSKCQ